MKILKGNYDLDVEPANSSEEKGAGVADKASEFRKKALASIGGSMVFVERKKLVWDEADGPRQEKGPRGTDVK